MNPAHTDWLRVNKALHALFGIDRFPGTDTVRNLFLRFRKEIAFGMKAVERADGRTGGGEKGGGSCPS